MTSLQAIVRESVDAVFVSQGRLLTEDVSQYALTHYGDDLAEESDRLVRQALRNLIKKALAESNDEDTFQLSLPGLRLPASIAVPSGEGFYYVRTDLATWEELEAGYSVRVANVAAADEKRRQYLEAKDYLRPLMEGWPARTVREALGFGEAA